MAVDGSTPAKKAAARRAAELVTDGMILGLGTGSTAAFFIQAIGERVREGLSVRAVVTSTASQRLAQDAGIALIDADSAGSTIDLDVDGADEIDPQLNLIKGAGGALLHEKLVALASRRMIVIADESKVVERLGGCAVPVEVVAFCHVMTRQRIEDLGVSTSLRTVDGGSPFITDSGNHIVDVMVPNECEVLTFGRRVKTLPGVVEHGVFEQMASLALIGCSDGTVRELTPVGRADKPEEPSPGSA